ncbi:MAG: universal stress protein, partial [Rhodothermales bacterium]
RGERPLRILVGADLDRASEAARAFASKLAMLGSTDIEVLLVASPDKAHERLGIESPAEDGTLVPEAEAILLRELSLSAPNNESSASLRVLSAHGGADAHLVARCDQGNFDLLVVGQRNRSIAQLVRRGSIMRGVLRASPVSVASVPIPIGETDLSVRHPHVVVVGMQLTDSDHRALRHAVAYAEAGASVHLVHVVEATRTDADLRDARDEAWYQLSKAAHETNDGSFSIEPHVVVGQPAEQLLTVAGRVGADLLVLGARRRPFVSRSLLGSVTQALVQDAPIPLLIVPARRP